MKNYHRKLDLHANYAFCSLQLYNSEAILPFMREYRDSIPVNPSAHLGFYQPVDWLLGKASGDTSHYSLCEDIALPAGFSMNPDEAEDIAIQGPPMDVAKQIWEEHTCHQLTEDFVDSFRDDPVAVSNNPKRPIVPSA